MDKKILFLGGLAIFSGCAGVDLSSVSDEDLERVSEKAVVCNAPYIRVGIECCLDSDENKICDRDQDKSKYEIKTADDENNEIKEIEFESFEDLEKDLLELDFDEKELEREIEELQGEFQEEIENYERELEEIEQELENIEDNENSQNYDDLENNEKFEIEADGIGLGIDYENNKLEVFWNELDEGDFQYYKVLHSVDKPDMTYPQRSAIYVGFDYDEDSKEFDLYKFDKGVNYFRIGYVYDDDNVEHSETLKIFIE